MEAKEILSETEAALRRERQAEERERRSNRVLDLRLSAIERHNPVGMAGFTAYVQNTRQLIIMAYVCIILLDLAILLHLYNTSAGIFAKSEEE